MRRRKFGKIIENDSDLLKRINPLYLAAFAVLFCIVLSLVLFSLFGNDQKDSDVLADADEPESSKVELVVWDETEADEVSTEDNETAETVDEPLYDADYSEDEGIHEYELIVDDVTWTEAYQDCINKGGYLVHFNSDDETAYVLKQIATEGYDNVYFYIGASRNEDSQSYYWVNNVAKHFGKALNKDSAYTDYWLYGEPSYQDTDFGTGEYFVDMLYHADEERWYFNDISDDGLYSFLKGKNRIGYIIEYELKDHDSFFDTVQ